MSVNSKKKIAVGLDIGTSKVCVLVASKVIGSDKLDILGIGNAPSEGLNRGVVVNIERTANSIKKAIEQAEHQSGIKIEEVVVGIAGDHIESFQTKGIVGISSDTHEITQSDIDRLLTEARLVAIPSEREIIHVMPQDYIIDGQDGIFDPLGMSGVRMEANVHIITGIKTAIENIHHCVKRCGVRVKDIVLEPIASSKALLSDEEKEVGVAIVDIGGGTTDVAIFEENIIRYSSVFGIAGRHVTADIGNVLNITVRKAETVKREYGHTYLEDIMHDEVFMIPGINGRKPIETNRTYLCQIIQPRMEELFEFALAEIKKSGFADRLGAGVIITGGTTLLNGTEELARKTFNMPIKIGIPTGKSFSGLAPDVESPIYSTGVGLVLYALENAKEIEDINNIEENDKDKSADNLSTDTGQENTDEKESKTKTPIIKKITTFIKTL